MFVNCLTICKWIGIQYDGLRDRMARGAFPRPIRKNTWFLPDIRRWYDAGGSTQGNRYAQSQVLA
jgi:hypothetical protein